MSFRERYLNKHIIFELSPGLVFYITNKVWGTDWGVFSLIVATIVFVVLGLFIEKRVPVFPIIGLIIVVALAGITLVSGNMEFIKIRPTIGKILFTLILLLGLRFKPSFLERALEGQVWFTPSGWTVLTFGWILVALIFAGINEFVWRSYDANTWIAFSAFVMPSSIVAYIIVTRITAIKYWDETKQNI